MQNKARLVRLERLKRSRAYLADCICFPVDEPPNLVLKAEIDAAEAVQCAVHGTRFSKLAPAIYTARQFIRPAHLQSESQLASHSMRYIKALKVSFPSDRWPATEIFDPDGSVRFVLKDGTDIHRIPPPPEIFDYNTGKLIGGQGHESEFRDRE